MSAKNKQFVNAWFFFCSLVQIVVFYDEFRSAQKNNKRKNCTFACVCVWQVEWDNYSGISQTWLQSRSVRKIINLYANNFQGNITILMLFLWFICIWFEGFDRVHTVCKAIVYLMVAFSKIVPTIKINIILFY